MTRSTALVESHPFLHAPNRTLIGLSVPVLFSLVAEPLTGLVDTAFVARLGADELAGLGVGTIAVSSFFWIFNFLGVGTQTEVAKALGAGRPDRAAGMTSLAIRLGLGIGAAIVLVGFPATGPIARVMGAAGAVAEAAETYMLIRWFGAPAILVMLGVFGSLRGVQDMRTPLWIAVGMNALNIVLDAVLIFGWGPIPALGIVGAAVASTVSQWVGAAFALVMIRHRFGPGSAVDRSDAGRLLKVGGDLFIRTGMLTLFLVLGTRAATRLGAESGAAHQAIRQMWVFTALFLDAWAISAQSLVGYFAGASRIGVARRVAGYASAWSAGTGVVLGGVLWLATPWVAAVLVPSAAIPIFGAAWLLALASLPLGALSFATDGIHWGTGDFAYLRNATILATVSSGGALLFFESAGLLTLEGIWWLTLLWVALRALLGVLRVWPGIGRAPLAAAEPA